MLDHAEVVRTLLDHGSYIEQSLVTDRGAGNGWRPLGVAAQSGSADVVRVLLEYGANKDGQVPSSGVTPLMAAVQEGHCDVVDALLVARAGVDIADNAGRTPLHEACRAGDREMCAILLAAGASVSARDQVRPPP